MIAKLPNYDIGHLRLYTDVLHPASFLQLARVHVVEATQAVLHVVFPVAFVAVAVSCMNTVNSVTEEKFLIGFCMGDRW